MAIRVLSFDFGGCLFNLNSLGQQDVIEANRILLENLREQEANYERTYTLIGSERQSHDIELVSSRHYPGAKFAFPAARQVANFLGAELDTFLLADIYGDLPAGASFARSRLAVKQQKQFEHADWIFDETKATILYAQMHRIANAHPGEEIIFDFYEDRSEVISALKQFYRRNPTMMPHNVSLRLNKYDGSQLPGQPAIIQGTGFIDANYRQTVKEIAGQCPRNQERDVIRAHRDVQPAQLRSRREGEVVEIRCNPLDEEDPARRRFEAALEAVRLKANDLLDDAKKYHVPFDGDLPILIYLQDPRQSKKYNSYIKAYEAAITLHTTLDDVSKKYFAGEIVKEQFSEIASDAIDTALLELHQHRGWGKVIANVGLAILGLGVFYGVACLFNYGFNKQFFFSFDTNSAEKVKHLGKSLESLPESTVVLGA